MSLSFSFFQGILLLPPAFHPIKRERELEGIKSLKEIKGTQEMKCLLSLSLFLSLYFDLVSFILLSLSFLSTMALPHLCPLSLSLSLSLVCVYYLLRGQTFFGAEKRSIHKAKVAQFFFLSRKV